VRVGQAFEVPVEQPIEPVVKLAALDDETALAAELATTVVTPLWEGYLDDLLYAYVQSLERPTSEVGFWISGYFGAGKSHLAKVILLALADRPFGARRAAELLLERVAPSARRHRRLGESVARLAEVSTVTLALNLAEVAAGRSRSLGELLLGAYYRSRGYGDNLLYAQVIEAELDRRGKLAELHRAVAACAGRAWSEICGNLSFYTEALCRAASELVPERFSSPEQVARALGQAESGELRGVGLFVRTALGDLERSERETGRRHRLLVVLDEAGAWIGSDGARLGELGALCELLASSGRGRAWLGVVTHGDLETVERQAAMAEADAKTIESRFRFRFDLTSENLGLVLEERLLRKTPAAERELLRIYAERGGALRELGELSGATRPLPACDATRFVRHYPLLPYHAQLVPEIVRTLRARAGREAALTPSTRTLLGVVQDVLRAGRRPHLDLALGVLVGLDEVCANLLASGELGPDAGRELERVRALAPEAGELGQRVAEILLLLDYARFVPRSEQNVARLLARSIEDDLPALHAALRPALAQLEHAGLVARVGAELELVTGEARVLEAELAARAQSFAPAELRHGFAELCRADGPLAPSHWLGFKTVAHVGRSFGFKLRLDGASLAGRRGDVVLAFFSPLASGSDPARQVGVGSSLAELESQSLRVEARHWVLFWCPPAPAFEQALARLLALRELCRRWQLDPARTPAEREVARERELRQLPALGERTLGALERAIADGAVVFRGSSRALAPREGERPGLALRAAMVKLWPAIYPKLDRVAARVSHEADGIRALLAGEAQRAAELAPLGFVDSAGRLDPHGPLLGAIRMLVRSQAAAGAGRHRPVRGRELLATLAAPPYGWDASAVRVGVAALVRLGAVELQLGAERLTDPARAELERALTDPRQFAGAELHAGLEAPAPEQLTEARALLVELGQPRAIEETTAAVGEAALRVAAAELGQVRTVLAWCEGLGIPADPALGAAAEAWQAVHDAPDPSERVALLCASGAELRVGHEAIERCSAVRRQAGSELAQLVRYGVELRAIAHRLPERGACARWLDELDRAVGRAQLFGPGTLAQLAPGWAQARAELDRLAAAWRQDARAQLDGALERLGGELGRAAIDPARAAALAAPLHRLRSSLERQLALGTLCDLPAQATSLIQELGVRLVCAELGLDPAAVRHLRPTDLSLRTAVHGPEQWEALKAELDARVRRWLADGELVVLD
jgi:hypothetical protein